MALNGFASGALVAAPIAAVLTWLALSWEQHVDIRVERDTSAVRADRAAFDVGFDHDWAYATGRPRSECDPDASAELVRLRARTAALEARLTDSDNALDRNVGNLGNMVERSGK